MKICLQHSTSYHWTILETKRDPEPYQHINVLLFLGLGENPQNQPTRSGHYPKQPFPRDDEHLSRKSLTFQIHVFPPTDVLSPLQLYDDTSQGSDNSLPTSYATSTHSFRSTITCW